MDREKPKTIPQTYTYTNQYQGPDAKRAERDKNRKVQLRWTLFEGRVYHWAWPRESAEAKLQALIDSGHREISQPGRVSGKTFS